MLRFLRFWKNEKGAASFWSMIVLVALIAVLAAAVYLILPRPQNTKPEPVVVRMKIPPMPSPEPTPPAEAEQASISTSKSRLPTDQEASSPPALASATRQADSSSTRERLSTLSDAPVKQAHGDPEAATSAAANDEAPPSLPSAVPEKTPENPMAEKDPVADNIPKKKKPTDGIALTPVADAPEEEKPSERILIAAANHSDENRANPIEPPGSKENQAASTERVEKPKPFSIQVGLFRSKANADGMVSDLAALGYSSFIHESQDKRQRPLYKVCFGRFETKRTAVQTAAAFKENEKKPAFVVRLASR